MPHYTLAQFEKDKARCDRAPWAAYRCSQYYLCIVLPAKWRAIKLWSCRATLASARTAMLYNTWSIQTTWEYIWHYFWLAWNGAVRQDITALLKKLGMYKSRLEMMGIAQKN